MQNIFTGVIDDPRSKEEKAKDWNAKELLGFAPVVNWQEKTEWKSFTPRNQDGSSTCVVQSIAKLLEINEKKETGKIVVFSASKAYADRTNEGAGSYPQQMLQYACKPSKYTTEDRIQSQNLSEDEVIANAKKWKASDESQANIYAGKSYLTLDINIDTIAYWISQGYGVDLLFWFSSPEWSRKFPQQLTKGLTQQTALRHSVAGVDFGLIQGQKFIKIEDSAWFGGLNERWISEDFLNTRCYYAGILFDMPDEDPINVPHKFTSIMMFGQTSTEIKFLQERLKAEGYFPKSIPSSGFYGTITQQAVEKYQRAKQVASNWELNLVRGKIVGIKTLSALNK